MKRFLKLGTKEYLPFTFMLGVNLALMIAAFVINTPTEIFEGFLVIVTSRSILMTDYIALAGLGPALFNVSVVGFSAVFMLTSLDVKPYGANIMGLWLTMGFSFIGKNVFNMIPLTFGVWLFSKYRKEPFSKYYLSALLVATLCPVVSEVAFLGMFARPVEITAGILLGFIVGFIFTVISSENVKAHSGFNLYNMGFAGGLIATILTTLLRNLGIVITPVSYISSGNNLLFAILLYSISAVMLVFGLSGGKSNLSGYRKIHNHSGQLVTDYYEMYGSSIYINMAVLCATGTTVALALGGQLNGPALAAILTMTGFGSLGKHIKNVTPVLIGAVISSIVNIHDPSATVTLVPTLFSTGLAPIAGKYGWIWGIAAGFLHVNVALFVGDLNGGMNLYNSGFAATFTAMFLIPIATLLKRDSVIKRDKYK